MFVNTQSRPFIKICMQRKDKFCHFLPRKNQVFICCLKVVRQKRKKKVFVLFGCCFFIIIEIDANKYFVTINFSQINLGRMFGEFEKVLYKLDFNCSFYKWSKWSLNAFYLQITLSYFLGKKSFF